MIYNSPTEKGNFHSLSIRVHVWFGMVWFCLINFVFCFGLIRFITGSRKTRLYCLTQSQNNCAEKPRLSGNLETRSEIKLGGVKPSCDCWMYCVYCPYPPLLIADLSDMRGELYILNAEEKFLSTQCCCHWSCDTRVLTSSSYSSSATSSPFFFLLWKRISWTFFRLSLCQFSD